MRWKKIANWLPSPDGFTHAAVPTYFEGRVYYSPRDSGGRSHIYSSKLDLTALTLSDQRHEVAPGDAGTFDDSGCMVSYINRDELGDVRIYFIGWNLCVTVPFRNALGVVKNGIKLRGPIKDRDRYDNMGVGANWGGLRWYTSMLGWERHEGQLRPRYHIVNGNPHSPAITFKDHEKEWAIARPCVIRMDGRYAMFYCYRGEQYRIGYAVSDNGLQWERRDEEAGIDVGAPGDFDDKAVCYPCVFRDGGNTYMLFNGSGYGKTGFGLAIMS